MAAELQSLLDKIQTEGIAKADAEASRILDEARKKAAAIVAEAERKQAAARAQAEADAKLFQQRAEQAVRIAARDVVLGVSEAVDQTLKRVLLAKLSESLAPDFLQTFVADVVRAYAASGDAGQGVDVLVSPEQADRLRDFLLQSVRDIADKGLRVSPDRDVAAGFRVSLAGGRIEHDFSAQAIQAAMARLLRPALAKLLASE